MKFRDIVNRDTVNLENCEDELIHIPGSIQPSGFLLGLKSPDLVIDFCSANVFEFTGLRHEQLLGKSIQLVLGAAQAGELNNYISSPALALTAPLPLTFMGTTYHCMAHLSGAHYVLEFEPWSVDHLKIADIYRQAKQVTTYMQKEVSLQMLSQYVADEIRSVTGYDRVMIYRFDEDYNGEVFAESKIDSIESWLNLHYPHTDIPVQARALYMRNLIRIIPDVGYAPVPVYTIDDLPDKNLDLSLSILRSSSPIHIQYLKNMGVAATLTISLVHQERLWGLIACHHQSPKYINNDVRIAAQLQGHYLTSQISVREHAVTYEIAKNVNKSLDKLLAALFSGDGISVDWLIHQPDLLAVTNASAVIILLNDEVFSHGNILPDADIRRLASWLQTYSPATGIDISNLFEVYPDAKRWSQTVSGILYHSLGSGLSNCIMWCRPELVQEVYWAGNPNEPFTRHEKSLSPRNSFAAWKEVKRYQSSTWKAPELTAATNFVNAFQKHLQMLSLIEDERKQNNLNEKLNEANAELENLYWIGSHDFKEPLRKIQMFASRIMDEESAVDFDTIFTNVKRMNDSAKRMQLLVSDIFSYSRLNYVDESLQWVDFDAVIDTAVAELDHEIKAQNAVIEYDAAVKVKGIFFFLQQLLVNLVRNALKFSKADTQPRIVIRYEGKVNLEEAALTQSFHKITVSDNGIGFDNQFKETIFKVFTRLHSQHEYGGSGVGLALCRKIMKNHKGYIMADGVPGVGACISLFFPAQ